MALEVRETAEEAGLRLQLWGPRPTQRLFLGLFLGLGWRQLISQALALALGRHS